MADAVCRHCGANLSFLDRLRRRRLCPSCAGRERDFADGVVTDSVLVEGLATVSDVAQMKRALSRLPGVKRVSVGSRPGDVFEFAVARSEGASLDSLVRELPGVSTSETGDPSAPVLIRTKR
jgi:hypothetical protein